MAKHSTAKVGGKNLNLQPIWQGSKSTAKDQSKVRRNSSKTSIAKKKIAY